MPRVRPDENGELPCSPPVSPGWPCLLLESPVLLHPEAWLVCTPPSANSSGVPTEVGQLGHLFAQGPARGEGGALWAGFLLHAEGPSQRPGSPLLGSLLTPSLSNQHKNPHLRGQSMSLPDAGSSLAPSPAHFLPSPPGSSPLEVRATTHAASATQLMQRDAHGGVEQGRAAP